MNRWMNEHKNSMWINEWKNEWTKKNEQMNEKMNEEWKPILIYWLIEKWMKNSDGIERNNSQKYEWKFDHEK